MSVLRHSQRRERGVWQLSQLRRVLADDLVLLACLDAQIVAAERATCACADGKAARAAATSRSAADLRTGSPRWAANLTNRLTPSAASRCGSANSAAIRWPTLVPNTSGNTIVRRGKQRSS